MVSSMKAMAAMKAMKVMKAMKAMKAMKEPWISTANVFPPQTSERGWGV